MRECELKENDVVDCIKWERVTGKCCWSRAVVMFVGEKEMSVRICNDNQALDRVLSLESNEVAL